MDFTYEAYDLFLDNLMKAGYEFASYDNWKDKSRPVILRHDIDYDIKKAVVLAQLEHNRGVESTYFVLVTSDFYNIFSKESSENLKRIIKMGHTIGLHFDEVRYPNIRQSGVKAISDKIIEEADLLSRVIDNKINCVSMHRPSKGLLEANLSISCMINSYSDLFFREFKYLSDSRRCWQEPVNEIIEDRLYDKLHILLHPFWYNENEIDLYNSVRTFVNDGNKCRYHHLYSNFSNLDDVMSLCDVR